MSSILVLLLLATAAMGTRADIDRRDEGLGNDNNFNVINRGRLDEHTVLMYLEDISHGECVQYCTMHVACRTVSYSSTERLCELNDMEYDHTEADVEAAGWTNYGTPARIDGGFSEWKRGPGCSQTCGTGHVTYLRSCDNPIPQHGGADCHGDEVKTEPCNMQECVQYDCVFQSGGSPKSVKVGYFDKETCVAKCIEMKKNDVTINGVGVPTYSPPFFCWCLRDMPESRTSSGIFESCELTPRLG